MRFIKKLRFKQHHNIQLSTITTIFQSIFLLSVHKFRYFFVYVDYWQVMSIEVRTRANKTPRRHYPVALVDLKDLIPHEETIPQELERTVKSLASSNVLNWPLMVDMKSKLLMDGHHRTAGLHKLGYKNAPVVLLDYMDNELVKLDTWYPLIKIPTNQLISYLESQGFNMEKVEPNSFSIDKLTNREFTAYIGNKEILYEVKGDREIIFMHLRKRWLDKIIYYDNPIACLENSSESITTVIPWAYNKKEVLDKVKRGEIFLPKTTRHTLKYETFKCHFPLNKLEKI